MMDRTAAVQLIEELSRLYLGGEMSGRAYARVAEGIIALAGLDDDNPEFDEFALVLATYSPAGGQGLINDTELRKIVERKLSGLP